MTKSRKVVLLVLSLLVLAGISLFLFGCHQETFSGSRVKNPDCYLLDIESMNGTDQHTLELNESDVLQIHFETVRGSMHLEILAPDGTAIYSGNGKELTDFTVIIPQSGVYTITLEASHAGGTLHIQLVE